MIGLLWQLTMHITAMFITESSLQNVLLPLWCQSFRSEFNEVCLWYLLHTDHLVLPTLYKSDFQQFYTAFFSFVWHIYTHSSVALHSFVYSIKLVRHAIFFLSLFISLLQHLDYLTSTQPWIFFFFCCFYLDPSTLHFTSIFTHDFRRVWHVYKATVPYLI